MTNPPATNATLNVSAKTNAVGDEAYSEKFIDPKTGQCAYVGLDKRTITLKDKNGNVIWTVNLINEAQKAGIHEVSMDIDWVGLNEMPSTLIVDDGGVFYRARDRLTQQ